MIVAGEEIVNYIPQRPPMVMVSGLHEADEKTALTSLLITSENLFSEDGFFTEPGIVEHIAQSTALHAGFGYIQAGKPVPIGYIAAVKDLTIHYLPKVGDTLRTEVKVVNNVMNVILVAAEVKSNGATVAACEMRVFIKE